MGLSASTLLRRPSPQIVLLLLVGTATGLALGRDFGLSWDEHFHKVYAEDTLDMYFGLREPGDTITDLRFYGPAFSVPWLILRNLLVDVFPGLHTADAGHLVYWLAFLPAPALIYALGRRAADRHAAFAAALLFVTQPLVFGHAFINPKDIPFTTAFLLAVVAGIRATDRRAERDVYLSERRFLPELQAYLRRITQAWKETTVWTRGALAGVWLVGLILLVDLLVTRRSYYLLLRLVTDAHAGDAIAPLQSLFDQVAQDAWKTPVTAYLEKARLAYLWGRYALLAIIAILLGLVTSRALDLRGLRQILGAAGSYPHWMAAALALGVCAAIRVFGLFAGALVAVEALRRLGRRSWPMLGTYAGLSALVLYLAWPFLWRSPLQHFWEAVFRMARFPWQGRVLYEGRFWSVTELPWHFPLRSLLYQLTLPAIVLGASGLFLAVRLLARRDHPADLALLFVMWLCLPLGALVLLDVQIYSPFRQLLFITPALFLLACLALGRLSRVLRGVWFWSLVLISLAPGVIGIVQLHPYEHVYYNELVGGVSGASGRYALESWGTAYREVVEHLNVIAPTNAWVLTPTGEQHTMTPFARSDLQITRISASSVLQPSPGSFVVDLGEELPVYISGEVVYTIPRAGAVLAQVIRLPSPDG